MPELTEVSQGVFKTTVTLDSSFNQLCGIFNNTGETLVVPPGVASGDHGDHALLYNNTTKIGRNKSLYLLPGKSFVIFSARNTSSTLTSDETLELKTSHGGATNKGTGVFLGTHGSANNLDENGKASISLETSATVDRYILVNRSGNTVISPEIFDAGGINFFDHLLGEQHSFEPDRGMVLSPGSAVLITMRDSGPGVEVVDFETQHGGPAVAGSAHSNANHLQPALLLFKVDEVSVV